MSGRAKVYPDLFKSRYSTLKGRRWILSIDPDDRKAWNEIGRKHSQFGRLGGLARKSAPRDARGRFTKDAEQ